MPDTFENCGVKVCKWVSIIVWALLVVILKLVTMVSPRRLTNEDLPEVSKAFAGVKAVTRLPVEAHGDDLLQELALVGSAIRLVDSEGDIVTLAPKILPPVVELMA